MVSEPKPVFWPEKYYFLGRILVFGMKHVGFWNQTLFLLGIHDLCPIIILKPIQTLENKLHYNTI